MSEMSETMIDEVGERERYERLTGLDGMVTIEEVARLTNKSYWQARRWLDARNIRRKTLGHTHLVRLADVQREIARYGSEM